MDRRTAERAGGWMGRRKQGIHNEPWQQCVNEDGVERNSCCGRSQSSRRRMWCAMRRCLEVIRRCLDLIRHTAARGAFSLVSGYLTLIATTASLPPIYHVRPIDHDTTPYLLSGYFGRASVCLRFYWPLRPSRPIWELRTTRRATVK